MSSHLIQGGLRTDHELPLAPRRSEDLQGGLMNSKKSKEVWRSSWNSRELQSHLRDLYEVPGAPKISKELPGACREPKELQGTPWSYHQLPRALRNLKDFIKQNKATLRKV